MKLVSAAFLLLLPAWSLASVNVCGIVDTEVGIGEWFAENGGLDEDVVVEWRVGNPNIPAQTHEFNIQRAGIFQTQDQFGQGTNGPAWSWTNGESVDWKVQWDGSGLLEYTIFLGTADERTLTWDMDSTCTMCDVPLDASYRDFDSFLLRTTARKYGAKTTVDNVVINGMALGSKSEDHCEEAGGCSSNSIRSQYLIVEGLPSSWTMTGTTTMYWDESQVPKDSGSAAQLKLGKLTCPTDCMTCGDPHFLSFSGEYYDYHGICDLVYLSNPEFSNGLGMDIHIRTNPRYEYSYIESAALRIGEDTLEVSSFGQYRLNGVEGAELNEDTKIAGLYPITHIQENKRRQSFVIQLDGKDEAIIIATNKDLVSVKLVNATRSSFGSSVGLMGDYVTGKLLARDGQTIIEDPNVLGQEWQVLEAEPKLFEDTDRHPQAPLKCLPPTDPSRVSRRRLGETKVTKEEAERACSHWGDHRALCEYDVMAMADVDLADAGAY